MKETMRVERRRASTVGALLRERLRAEEGFSLLELMAALTIITFGFLALAGAASTGARLLAEGKQRQGASEIASRQLEHLRNVPYEGLAHPDALTHNTAPDNPDYFVEAPDGEAYDRTGTGVFEPLVIDGDGEVVHTEAFMVGSTSLTAYHYVTWVDDPALSGTENYKRVTVVVAYNTPVSTGRPTQVRVSSLITDGEIEVGGSALQVGQGTQGIPLPSPTPSPSGACSGDNNGPTGSISLLSGTGAQTGYTASSTVTVSMSPSDACLPITVAFSNDNVTFGSYFEYQSATPTATWQLTAGEGPRTVWARFKDGVGNVRALDPAIIVVDSTPPSAPGALNRTLSCSGSNRTASLSWGAAADTNLVGYRVYRQVDNGPWEVVATPGTLTAANTHLKTLDSVRFKVLGYDAAGNEGTATNEIALTKNQCS